MSHDIYETMSGKQSIAYVNETPWHGLGQKLTPNATFEVWLHESGMDYELYRAPVQFWNQDMELIDFGDNQVLYRSDNNEPLSVVSKSYKPVQPVECLNFFKEFCEAGEMTLETVGSIQNGKKYWALAKVQGDFTVDEEGNDVVKPYMLIASSCDRTLSTVVKRTTVRVVCNNTLSAAIPKALQTDEIRVNHSTVFDHNKVKADMGLSQEIFQENANAFRKMHKQSMDMKQAINFFLHVVSTDQEIKERSLDVQKNVRTMNKLVSAFENSPGHEPTLWGAVNAVTHSVDFNPHARTNDSRLNNAWFGAGETLKNRAYTMAMDENLIESICEKTINADDNRRALDSVLNMVPI